MPGSPSAPRCRKFIASRGQSRHRIDSPRPPHHSARAACRAHRREPKGQCPPTNISTVVAPRLISKMPNLENLRKQAKLVLRWHHDRYYPVAAQIRSALPRFRAMTDAEILSQSFKLGDAQELVARQHGFESWQALKKGF